MSTMERLWWDYEFVAQMQRLDDSFVLKGGAAAQLFLKPALQRGSRDVDFVTRLDRDHILRRFSELQAKFEGSDVEVRPFVPRQPVIGLPLMTYEVYFEPTTYKAIFGPNGRQDYIKLEVLSEDVEIATTTIKEKETPVIMVSNVKCVTSGALLGDKLMTLSSGTIGTVPEEQPKQLYDIDNIAYGNDLTKEDIGQIMQTFDTLTRIELGLKGRKETPMDVLDDIVNTLDAFSKSDLSSGDRKIRDLVRNFENSYVSRNAMLSPSGWSARALRVRLLTRALKSALREEMDESRLANMLAKAKQLASRLREDDGLREKLSKLTENPRELRGKPIDRLFWEAADPYNVEDLEGVP